MPGLAHRGQKRPSTALSDGDEASDASSPPSFGTKRARHHTDASDVNGQTNGASGRGQAYDSSDEGEAEDDNQGFQPGSIVRVTLRNFVTYTAAEFHPGPSLNMVIGPNGNGKSTLVCAICLGLGWDPKNLGRAKEIGAYVKHGSTEAAIEIELAAGPQHHANPVIKRIIRKEGNQSQFFLNKKQVPQKRVVELAKQFSIQIDNLCQFLPQDRVVEFAGLTPVALLRETLRAAAEDNMVQWLDELIKLRGQEKQLEINRMNEYAQLKQLQLKQNATEEDVRRYDARKELEKRLEVLEMCKPAIESRIVRQQHSTVKAQLLETKEEQAKLQAEVAPAQVSQEEMEVYQRSTKDVLQQRRALAERARKHAEEIDAKIKNQQSAIANFQSDIKGEYDADKNRKQDERRLEIAIADITRKMEEAPVEVDEDDYNEKRAHLHEKKLAISNESRRLADEQRSFVAANTELQRNLQQTVNQRASLDTQSGQRTSQLEKVSQHTATAWKWIEENRGRLQLKGKIYGPPLLTCSVIDQRYADVVEAQLGGVGDVTAITFTHPDDQRLVSNKIFGNAPDGLGLHQVTVRTVQSGMAHYRSPLTDAELRDMGFESWLLDYLQGPEDVLAMLCAFAKLHEAAYSSKRLTKEQHQRAESKLSSWVTERDKFRITRRYGQSSARVTAVNTAKFFTDQPVDVEEKRRLDEEKDRIEAEIEDLRKKFEACTEQRKRLKKVDDEIKHELDSLEARYGALRKARAMWEAFPEKKAAKEVDLAVLRDQGNETSSRIFAIEARAAQAALKAASYAIEYQKAVTLLRLMYESVVEADIRLIEATSELEALKEENQEINARLEQMEQSIQQLDAQRQDLAKRFKKLVVVSQRNIDTLTEEQKAIMQEFSQKSTVEELEDEIQALNNRLAMMAEGNSDAVIQFENRKKQIKSSEIALAAVAKDLKTTQEKITTIRAEFEPNLDELVATISEGFAHNFAQIGCAGQVDVHKDEDFEHWAIRIHVRFRENESMSILDNHRQSGGERAVSTIFYLMALQGLARSPFRVVDEINQGMDPRNERMVHERMVDIACHERTSQYFLITPKLLSNLKFHPKMKVHCIASGEHMPSQQGTLDLGKLAQVAMRNKLQAGA